MKTKVKAANQSFASFASQMARNPHTLARFQDAMKDAKRKKAIGERMTQLRERRGFTQPQVAGRVGTSLRNYQNWEAGGGTSGENYESVADVLGCSYDYLVMGAESTPPREDILARLDGIEAALEQLLVAPTAAETKERAAAASQEVSRPAKRSKRKPQRHK